MNGAMNSGEQCVPLAALAIPGEGEAMEAPEAGDQVNFTVEGKISRVDGQNAYVRVESVNGQPLENTDAPADAAAEPEGDEADSKAYDALSQQADQMGAMG